MAEKQIVELGTETQSEMDKILSGAVLAIGETLETTYVKAADIDAVNYITGSEGQIKTMSEYVTGSTGQKKVYTFKYADADYPAQFTSVSVTLV